MTKKRQTKKPRRNAPHGKRPQCDAHTEGLTADGGRETFFCVLRVRHRGPHAYHESMATALPDHPISAVMLPHSQPSQ